jgi:hypothetical protein
MILSLLLLATAQAASDKLPPATPLPLADPDTAAVMAPVDALFAGLSARDAGQIAAQLRDDGGATVASVAADGSKAVHHLSWAEFTAGIKAGPEKYEERLSDPAIEMDGDIAMIWGPYTFFLDGKPHHCGVDHFDLVRENGAWKIQNITWSQRTTGCAG